MTIFYLVNARMPTEKAHGVAIAKSCEAFACAGATVELVVPRRYTPFKGDVFSAYGIDRVFNIRRLFVIDALRWFDGSAAFFIEAVTFYVHAFFFMICRSRKHIVYTRDVWLCLLSLVGFRVWYECHAVARHRLFFWLARRAQGVIPISHALASAFVAHGFPQDAIVVAPSGVDLSVFAIETSREDARRQLALPPHVSLAVYTGNFTTFGEDKGIADILHALALVPHVMFVAYGGSEADIARYEQVAHVTGVSDRVLLRSHVSQSVLALVQRAAHMLLMPFPDTPHYRAHMSPVKMFEYMASGRPIIASDLPTIREILNDDISYGVPAGDVRALACMMSYVHMHPQEAEAKAMRARKVVEAYTWSTRAAKILSLIQRTCDTIT